MYEGYLGEINMVKVVLTTDRTLMSEYNNIVFLGFAACAPKFIPGWLYTKIFCPPAEEENGFVKYGHCGQRKIEASLLNNGFNEKDIAVVRPERLDRIIDKETKVLCVTTHDPLGLGPASSTFSDLGGRESYTSFYFRKLITNPLIRKHNLRVIVGGSGAWQLENDLIEEMKDIFKATKPDEKLLVIDAATGQQAGPQAKAFNDAIDITGIVLTKLDGTAKGGGALSAAAEVGAPIVFIGTGEHSKDFERFEPAGFISRLLGMGDIKSLLEKAEESLKGKDAEKTARRIMSGKFTLHDMYDQMDMLSGMGSLRKIAEMLPGGFPGKGRLKQEDMDDTENKLQKFRVIMDSMTDEEMNDPNIVRASRIKRIARGAGVENRNVKELLKYYNMTKRMMKGFSGDRKMRKNLMKQLQFGK